MAELRKCWAVSMQVYPGRGWLLSGLGWVEEPLGEVLRGLAL